MENHKTTNKHQRAILKEIAHRAMLERGLLPDFSREALAELGRIQHSPAIDGNPTRDLDQLTVAEAIPDGRRHKKSRPRSCKESCSNKKSTLNERAFQAQPAKATAFGGGRLIFAYPPPTL